MKNAAFVKMRDSVIFCKQILIEYVLKGNNNGWGLCASSTVVADKSHVAHSHNDLQFTKVGRPEKTLYIKPQKVFCMHILVLDAYWALRLRKLITV